MDHKLKMKIIENIELNIEKNINVEKLSSKIYISQRQLYRDFYSITGHSINEYINKRKLSRALNMLKLSEISITDIAFICGYSSVQALYRSIKSVFNITPANYRNNFDIYYFSLSDSDKIKNIIVKNQIIPKTICIKFYHPQLKGIEEKAINYFQSIIPQDIIFTGRLFGRNGIQKGSKFCYELYIEYKDEFIKKTSDIINIEIHDSYTATFAYTTVKFNEQDINDAWDYLYGHWLKNSMFQQDNIPYFEEYILKGNEIHRLILHLPIKARNNFYKINIKPFENRLFITTSQKGINAEKSSSNIIVDFIADHYPLLLKTQKEFYVSKNNEFCVCGLNIDNLINISDNVNIQILTIPEGIYAVLEGSCYGSGNDYEQVLLNWLQDNGFIVIGTPFSIYDTSKSTNQNEIIVKSQVMIKDGRI